MKMTITRPTRAPRKSLFPSLNTTGRPIARSGLSVSEIRKGHDTRRKTVSSLFCSLVIVIAFGATVLSSAQERQMGGVGITVFADPNFRGKTQTFVRDVPNLASFGLSHQISSLRIGPGEQWEVCERPNYQGRCVVVSGEELVACNKDFASEPVRAVLRGRPSWSA